MEEEESTRKAKKGWYPGKYASGGHAEKVDKTEKAEEDESQKSKSGWYPGKLASKAIRRTSTTSTPSTIGPSSSPNSSENRRQSVTNDRVSTPGDSSDRRGSELLRESIDLSQPRNPLAKVRITIHEVRYLTIKSAKMFMELDDLAWAGMPTEVTYPLIREFDLLNITSDFKIEFRGSGGSPSYGLILIPIASLVKFTGSPLPPKRTWREIYPYYDKLLLIDGITTTTTTSKQIGLKFRSGMNELPGSAMIKPSISLGFVSLEIELILPSTLKNIFSFYFLPNPAITNAIINDRRSSQIIHDSLDNNNNTTTTHNMMLLNEVQLAINQARIQRDIERLKNMIFRPPSCIEMLLSLPEIFILIIFTGFICYSVSTFQIPFVFVFVIFFNGKK
jgi:hypothetical protein